MAHAHPGDGPLAIWFRANSSFFERSYFGGSVFFRYETGVPGSRE
jgi:hypothetical protein